MFPTPRPPLSEAAQRIAVLAEARSWIGTPYHRNQMCKGAGVDCGRFLYKVFYDLGMIPEEKIGVFGYDFGCHTSVERYMFKMLRHAAKVAEECSFPSLKTTPGNLALVQTEGSRIRNHGGIITKWPKLIHAAGDGVMEVDASAHWLWEGRSVQIFDPWQK